MKVFSIFLFSFLIACQSSALEQEFFVELDMTWNYSWQDKTNFFAYTESDSFLSGLGGGLGYRISFDLDYLQLGGVFSYQQKSEDIIRSTGASNDEFSMNLESTRVGLFLKLPLWQGLSLYSEYCPSVLSKVKKQNSSAYSPMSLGDSLIGVSSGYGLYMYWQNNIAVSAIFRQTIYKDVGLSGTSLSLPNDQYNRMSLDEFVVQMSYWY